MKTRRILAASTAALLAFGTTAAYVASAAVSTAPAITNVLKPKAYPADCSAIADNLDMYTVKQSGKTVTITVDDATAMTKATGQDDPTALIVVELTGSTVDGDTTITRTNGVSMTGDETAMVAIADADVATYVTETAGKKYALIWTAITEDRIAGETTTVTFSNGTGKTDSFDIVVKDKAVAAAAAAAEAAAKLTKPAATADVEFGDVDLKDGEDIGGDITISLTEAAQKKLENYSIGGAKRGVATVSDLFTMGSNGVELKNKNNVFGKLEKSPMKALTKSVKTKKVNGATVIDPDVLGKEIQVFNIELGYADGAGDETFDEDIKLGAKVTVKIKSSVKGNVYHISSNGKSMQKVDAARSKGINDNDGYYFYTFETNTFSPFVVADLSIDGLDKLGSQAGEFANSGNNAPDSSAAATSNGGTTTNPDTGIALAIAPVVLAAGAVAVVALKKKH